jgi:hypothetical protein
LVLFLFFVLSFLARRVASAEAADQEAAPRESSAARRSDGVRAGG